MKNKSTIRESTPARKNANNMHKPTEHLLLLQNLLQNGLTAKRASELAVDYKADNIKIKPYKAFAEDSFYWQMMKDLLFNMPNNAGRFNDHRAEGGVLAPLCAASVSQMTDEMLRDPRIRYCFSLLDALFNGENLQQAFNSLINLINCSYHLNPQVYQRNLPAMFELINSDVYQTILQYVIQNFEKKRKAICSELPEEINHFESHLKNWKALQKTTISIDSFKQFLEEFLAFDNSIYKVNDIQAVWTLTHFKRLYLDRKGENETALCFALIRSYYEYYRFKKAHKKLFFQPYPQNEFYLLMDNLILNFETKDYSYEISEIINNNENIIKFIKILKSPTVKGYYTSKLPEVKDLEQDYSKIEAISADDIEELKQWINSTVVIVPLDRGSKAITTSFLRIALNSS